MALWHKEQVFPMIDAVIRSLHHLHRRSIHQREISARLQQVPPGRDLVARVQRRRNQKTREWEAMAMVAQFSKLYEGSIYETDFRRTRGKGGYSYVPRGSARAGEVPLDLVQGLESQIEKKAGFQADAKVRKAIELHAMQRAEGAMRKKGYIVKDVSKQEPYDLLCEKAGHRRYVEVKGTQAGGAQFVLTAGEVNFIRRNTTDCTLCVVHDVKVNAGRRPEAWGGKLALREPFRLSSGKLRPIAFTFSWI